MHAYEVIDGYSARFKRLQEGEQSYAEFSGKMWHYPPTPPVRPGISDSELKDLRRRLAESIYLVLRRCYKEDLIEEPDLERFGASLSLDIVDIKRLDK